MFDFKNALKAGLDSAQQADRNKKEIFTVFEALSSQVLEETSGTVKLSLETPDILSEAFAQFNKPRRAGFKGEYKILTATNPSSNGPVTYSPVEICRLAIDVNGYPCSLEYSGDTTYAEDIDGLANNLKLLLANSLVGEKIYKVMKR